MDKAKAIGFDLQVSPDAGKGPLALAVVLLVATAADRAWAGLPEMEEALSQRSRDEWSRVCPDGSTTGVACQGTVCGVDFQLDAAAVQRFITIDGGRHDLHAGDNSDMAVAAYLNRVCNGWVSSTASALEHQLRMTDDILRLSHEAAHRDTATAAPGPTLTMGGALEHGSHGTNALAAPFGYAHSFSRDMFVNLNGTLSGALVPGAGLFAFDALPSFGLLGGNRKFDWGVGGFAPVALGFVSYSPLALTTASYNAGLGGIGIFNADLGRATLSGGAVVEGRYSDPGRGHLPLNALVQVTYPVSIIDAVGSVAVANDPLYPHTFGSAIRLGAGWGDWQFGYQLFVTSGYVGHQLGFLHRQKLRRSELLERPQAPPPQPTSSPPPAAPASSPESSTEGPSDPEAAEVETTKPESTDPAPAELESPDTEPADTPTVPSASEASGEPSTAETNEGPPPELRPADDTVPADGAIE